MIRLPFRRRVALPAAALVATASVLTVWLTEEAGGPARWRSGTAPSSAPPDSLAPWPATPPPSGAPDEPRPGDDQPGGDRPGNDQPGSDQRGDDQRGDDQRGGNQPGNDQPGADQPGVRPGQERPAQERPGGNTPPAEPSASLDDLLENDAPPPPGVADQVNFFLGGGPDCPDTPASRPRVRVPDAVVEIPSVPYLCPEGFDGRRSYTVTVSGPGTTRTVHATRPDLGVPWPIRPGMPVGRYHVLVTQGARNAAGEFEVRRAVRPRLWTYPRLVEAGAPVEVHLGGFPPGRRADLHLYKTPGLVYRATTTVAVDARGEASLRLRTSRATEHAHYALNNQLVHDPPPDADPAMPFGSDAVFLVVDGSQPGDGP